MLKQAIDQYASGSALSRVVADEDRDGLNHFFIVEPEARPLRRYRSYLFGGPGQAEAGLATAVPLAPSMDSRGRLGWRSQWEKELFSLILQNIVILLEGVQSAPGPT